MAIRVKLQASRAGDGEVLPTTIRDKLLVRQIERKCRLDYEREIAQIKEHVDKLETNHGRQIAFMEKRYAEQVDYSRELMNKLKDAQRYILTGESDLTAEQEAQIVRARADNRKRIFGDE